MLDCKPNGIHILFQRVQLFRRPPPPPALRDLDVQDVEHDGNAQQRGQQESDADPVVAVLLAAGITCMVAGITSVSARSGSSEPVELVDLTISLLESFSGRRDTIDSGKTIASDSELCSVALRDSVAGWPVVVVVVVIGRLLRRRRLAQLVGSGAVQPVDLAAFLGELISSFFFGHFFLLQKNSNRQY